MTNPSCQSDGLCPKKPPGSVWASKCMTPYMPEFDVCAQVASTNERSSVELAACDGSDAQSFVFSDEGTITPVAAADMCLTVGKNTRTGRSVTIQIKALTVETCSDADVATQTWGVRTAD